ncbi:hypothetical protein [Silanimonas sp.]|uniref:hypothetical protein n=1 Tax=Silanimonas sp. TaxID=1929290 RepID=UPI0022C7B616|nr:hypothetical protein [Silanimonas sp.]MCZ8063144.1 hypothetical protein [Silanimonas sp.]
MDLDTLKTTWKSLDERLARIEALQSEANAIERARDAEARASAGQLASRRALRPLAIGLGLQAIAGVTLATIAVAFWAKRMDAGAQFIVYGVLVQAYAVALIASAGHELSLIRRVRMTGAVLDMQGALAALRRWRETVGWVLGLAGGVIWVPLLLMGLAVLGADVWTERPSLIGWLALWAVGGTAAVWAILRWAERHPRFGASMRANAAGQSVRRAELALSDVRAFEAEGR